MKNDREYRLRHSQTIENIKQAQLMGHAFNLPHTFDGDYNSNDVTYSCGEDNIFDTPKHIRTMSINGLY